MGKTNAIKEKQRNTAIHLLTFAPRFLFLDPRKLTSDKLQNIDLGELTTSGHTSDKLKTRSWRNIYKEPYLRQTPKPWPYRTFWPNLNS